MLDRLQLPPCADRPVSTFCQRDSLTVRCQRMSTGGARQQPRQPCAGRLAHPGHEVLIHVDGDGGGGPVVAKTVRRKFINVPGRLTRRSRRAQLHLPTQWPWATEWSACFDRLRALPLRRGASQASPAGSCRVRCSDPHRRGFGQDRRARRVRDLQPGWQAVVVLPSARPANVKDPRSEPGAMVGIVEVPSPSSRGLRRPMLRARRWALYAALSPGGAQARSCAEWERPTGFATCSTTSKYQAASPQLFRHPRRFRFEERRSHRRAPWPPSTSGHRRMPRPGRRSESYALPLHRSDCWECALPAERCNRARPVAASIRDRSFARLHSRQRYIGLSAFHPLKSPFIEETARLHSVTVARLTLGVRIGECCGCAVVPGRDGPPTRRGAIASRSSGPDSPGPGTLDLGRSWNAPSPASQLPPRCNTIDSTRIQRKVDAQLASVVSPGLSVPGELAFGPYPIEQLRPWDAKAPADGGFRVRAPIRPARRGHVSTASPGRSLNRFCNAFSLASGFSD